MRKRLAAQNLGSRYEHLSTPGEVTAKKRSPCSSCNCKRAETKPTARVRHRGPRLENLLDLVSAPFGSRADDKLQVKRCKESEQRVEPRPRRARFDSRNCRLPQRGLLANLHLVQIEFTASPAKGRPQDSCDRMTSSMAKPKRQLVVLYAIANKRVNIR